MARHFELLSILAVLAALLAVIGSRVHLLWYISLGKKSFELQDNLNDFGELSESP